MDDNTCAEVLKILEGVAKLYDKENDAKNLVTRRKTNGQIEMGVNIFLPHDKAAYLKKVIARAKRPRRAPEFINPTTNPSGDIQSAEWLKGDLK